MTIDEVAAGTTTLASSRSDGQWHYTVLTAFDLQTADAGGRLQAIEGADLLLLTAQFGWQPEWRVDLHYDEAPNGGSPSLAQVIADAGAAVAARLSQVRADWCGKVATARLEEQP